MSQLVYDEVVGWFDPQEAYCANSCGRLAVGESLTGIFLDEHMEDGFVETVELLCANCLEE